MKIVTFAAVSALALGAASASATSLTLNFAADGDFNEEGFNTNVEGLTELQFGQVATGVWAELTIDGGTLLKGNNADKRIGAISTTFGGLGRIHGLVGTDV